jgi:two-component sensor histidine kinase
VKLLDLIRKIMIYRSLSHLNISDRNCDPGDQQQVLEEEVVRQNDILNRYRKHLEILNQASVIINSVKNVPSILRTVAQAALELWRSDGAAAGNVENGELLFRDFYWKGDHRTKTFKCNILPELNNMTAFMEVLHCEDNCQDDNCFSNFEDDEIKERLAFPIYDRQLKVQACLLLFNPSSGISEQNPIDHPLPGLISSAVTALDNMKNLQELRNKEYALQCSLKEKDLLLKEIHHRVKNNLQAMVSLLEAHLGVIQNPRDKEVFLKGRSLAMAMSMVHEMLYSTEDYEKVDFSKYIQRLVRSVLHLYPDARSRVKVVYDTDEMYLNTDTAVPVSLIINELVSNALIHGFPDGRKGTVTVSMKQVKQNGFMIEIEDDGVGVPDPGCTPDNKTLGLNLVRTLMENLHGTMKVKVNGGTCITLRLKEYFECEDLELG